MDSFGNKRVPNKPPGFKSYNPYSAGKKHYGGGRSMPNVGPVRDMKGYAERDRKSQAQKDAVIRRLKGQQSGNPMNPDIMRSDLKRGG